MWAVLKNEAREVQDKNSDYGPTSREYSAHSDFQTLLPTSTSWSRKSIAKFPIQILKTECYVH
jgi:hypothetical protein